MTSGYGGLPLSRRRFVQGAGVTGLGLLAGCGQLPSQAPAAVAHRIGYLDIRGADDPERAILWDALRDLGYREGQDLAVEYRLADGHLERLAPFAAELAAANLELIIAAGTIPARVASEAAPQTPIVMVRGGGDGISSGLIESLARPGGNVTGVVTASPDIAGKWLELLKDIVPGLSRVGIFSDPANDSTDVHLRSLGRTADLLHVQLLVRDLTQVEALPALFAAMTDDHADALILVPGGRATLQRSEVAALALANRVPTAAEWREFATGGGLISYGASRADLGQRAASYVDKILRGAKPADLPVERPMRFDFVVNLKTAQALGLTIPQHVLLQATEVIQ